MSVGTSYRWSNTHSDPTLASNYRSRGHSKPYRSREGGRNRDMREGYDIELEWSRGDVHEDFCNDYPDSCYIVTEEQVRQYYNLTNKDWILDSGASCHIIGNMDYFTKSWEVDDTVTPVGGKKLTITRRGDVYLSVQDGKSILKLKDCVYIPSNENIIAVSIIDKAGLETKFTNGECWVKQESGAIVLRGATHGTGLYKINPKSFKVVKKGSPETAFLVRSWQDWHRTLGHTNIQDIKTLHRRGIIQAKYPQPLKMPCDICIQGKMRALNHPTIAPEATQIGERIVMDLWGPTRTTGRGGYRFTANFVDAYSRITAVFPLKSKDDALGAFKQFHGVFQAL